MRLIDLMGSLFKGGTAAATRSSFLLFPQPKCVVYQGCIRTCYAMPARLTCSTMNALSMWSAKSWGH